MAKLTTLTNLWSSKTSSCIVLFFFVRSVIASCPPSCECSSDYMRCKDQMPSALELQPSTQSLYMTDCKLSPFSAALGYTTLRTLDITGCNIRNIPNGTFSGMSHLKSLVLDDNELKFDSSSSPFLGLSSLTELSLKRNGLIGSPPIGFFTGLTSVEKLDLSGNVGFRFQDCSMCWAELTHMSVFICEDCGLTNLSSVAPSLNITNITSLLFHGNNFTSIPTGAFLGLSQLKVLNLSYCQITQIDSSSSFTALPRLHTLDLSHNRLALLPAGSLFPDLRVLYLDNNQFKRFTATEIAWSSLDALTLEGNPWQCDCELAWMRNTHLTQMDPANVTCLTPATVSSQSVLTFRLPCPCRPEGCGSQAAVALGIIIPVLGIGALVLGCCVYRCILNRRRRARERKSFRYSAVYKETVELSSTNPNASLVNDGARF